jgi:hypothetical protein
MKSVVVVMYDALHDLCTRESQEFIYLFVIF